MLRPTSLGSNAGVVSSSGTSNAWIDLSDDDDNTVTRGSSDLSYAFFALTDVTLSAGQRVRQVRTRVRYGRDAQDVGRVEEARVRLWYAGKHSSGDWYRSPLPTIVTASSGWQTTAPGGAAWSEPAMDGLQAEVTWYANDSDVYYLRLSELWVDVETNSAPVVSAVTVTGQTSTTTPAWSFAYADSDGDPQLRWQVKVFSAAQYGNAGFSADTSQSVWNSGELSGATTAGTVGVSLANGSTYKAYARAAQSWAGPQGTLWWSAWAASSAFTIALTPPATPTVAVAGQSALPDYRALLTVVAPASPGGLSTATGTVGVQRGERLPAERGTLENWAPAQVATGGSTLRTSQGFKTDAGSDSTGWEPVSAAFVAAGATGVAGVQHWKVRTATTGQLYLGASASDSQSDMDYRFPVAPGLSHTLSLWAATATGTFATNVWVEWLRGDGTVSANSTITPTFTTTPTLYSVSGTCPADAVEARAVVKNSASAASADVYVTRVGFGLALADGRPGTGGPVAWSAVRALDDLDVTSLTTSQTFLVQDHEVVPARPVLYRAVTTAVLATGETVASAPSTPAVAYLPAPARALLTDPWHPERAVLAMVDRGDSAERSKDAAVIHPLGRDADPVMVTSWMSGRDGSYAMTAMSDTDLARFDELLGSATALLVQWSEGGQAYVLVTADSSTRVVPGFHRVSASGVGCKRPA